MLQEAVVVMDDMRSGGQAVEVQTYNLMIVTCTKMGHPFSAINMYKRCGAVPSLQHIHEDVSQFMILSSKVVLPLQVDSGRRLRECRLHIAVFVDRTSVLLSSSSKYQCSFPNIC